MKISKKGLDFIKKKEGFRNFPYMCPALVPTIGYGFTFYPDGTKVQLTDKPITQAEATQILCEIIKKFESGVIKLIKKPITQNQFDALVSFAFNLGLGAFNKSTLLKKINNNPNDPSIDYEFSRWVKANGKVLKGLQKRRNQESWLYFEHLRNKN